MSTLNKPAATLSDRMTQLTQQISGHESAISRSTRMTNLIGVIALVALSVYFYVGYTMIADLLQPERLVPYGARMLEDRLPEARRALVKQIADSAPHWAEQVSVQARKEIPGLRGQLETYVLSNTDQLLAKVSTLTEDQFRKTLQENRELVESGFKELSSSDKLSDATLAALVNALEQELKSDMKSQAKDVLETLQYLSERVQRLSAGKSLDEQERYMRQILMIARRMRDTTADDTPIKSPEVKNAEPVIEKGTADKPEAKSGDDEK